MDITSITVEAGFTMNAGDFQSVKATIGMRAELGRGEDVDAATAELRAKVMDHLIGTASQAHPDAARKLLGNGGGGSTKALLDNSKTDTAQVSQTVNGEGQKRTRRTKEQIAADEAAAKAKLSETSGMGVGGLDKEDDLDKLGTDEQGADDLDDLLGDTPEPVTREMVQGSLVKVVKHSKPAMLEMLKAVGAANLGQVPEAKYQELYAKANAFLAKHS